jgi:hypothetical protein
MNSVGFEVNRNDLRIHRPLLFLSGSLTNYAEDCEARRTVRVTVTAGSVVVTITVEVVVDVR